jgi:hypothetical protein
VGVVKQLLISMEEEGAEQEEIEQFFKEKPMPLKTRSNSRKANQEAREKNYKKIAALWEKKDYPGQFSISVDNYHGELIFKQIEKDEDKGLFRERYFRLKYISLFEPKEYNGNAPPKNLQYNLLIDLNNEKTVEFVGETDWQPIEETSDGGNGQEESEA